MKHLLYRIVAVVSLMLMTLTAYPQSEAFEGVRSAMRNANSRAVAQYFGGTVEMEFYGDRQSYSATQAEFVLKDFFAKNNPITFELVHKGSSNNGIPYAIGHLTGKSGSYRVFIKMKPVQGTFQIDNLYFTKE